MDRFPWGAPFCALSVSSSQGDLLLDRSSKVRLKVDLPRPLAEALAAEAIRREMKLPAFVTELLEIAAMGCRPVEAAAPRIR